MGLDEDARFIVGRRLKQDFQNGRSYYGLAGRVLQLPPKAARRPASKALA